MEAIQLESLVIILEAIAKSALLREESRGAHYLNPVIISDSRPIVADALFVLKS